MASGRTHEAYGKAIGILTISSLWLLGAPPFPIALGQAVALFIASPDVDTASNSTNRWGMLSFIWSPLQSVTTHRGLTHNPVVGPIVVMGYLAIVVFGFVNGFRLAVAASMGTPFSIWLPTLNEGAIAWFMVGAFIQYWGHLALDILSSWSKKGRRTFTKRLVRSLLGGKR